MRLSLIPQLAATLRVRPVRTKRTARRATLRVQAPDEPRQAEVVPLSPLPPSLPPCDRLRPCRPRVRDADSDAVRHGVLSDPYAVQWHHGARAITSLRAPRRRAPPRPDRAPETAAR